MDDKISSTKNNYNIFDTTDIFGKRVFLEKEQFDNHIVVGHPEMRDNELAIQETIENPQLVVESKQNSNRLLYIGKSEMSTYPMVYIKTVVDHSSKEYGFVITGLFQKKVNLEKEGTVIYEKTTDTDSL
ncbi:hypothetical protein ACFVAD_16345 [Sutcliffiella sp. NPDC057660]|uniref:hypothetical protein n=1 Tax=Sutcliffiella sp. NPDC057660 TaxID=3346199 RepID=UPI0036C6506F